MSCGIVPIIIDRMLNWGVKFSRVAILQTVCLIGVVEKYKELTK